MKQIYIDSESSIEKWVDDNKLTIINTLYDNIFDFSKSDEITRLILKVIVNSTEYPNKRINISNKGKITFDFILNKADIDHSISALIERFEEIEDYEKCSELIKLKKNEI